MIDCFQRTRTIPPQFIEWANLAAECSPTVPAQRENELFQIIARLCSLRSIYKRGNEAVDGVQDDDDPTILSVARDIDADLAGFEKRLTENAGYTVKPCAINEHVLLDYYYDFPNRWIVGVYNLVCAARVSIHELILTFITHNPSSDPVGIQRRASDNTLENMNIHICASVPFVLGGVDSDKPSDFIPRAAAGTVILWPLYVAATQDGVKPSTRAWVITRLEKLGHDVGIQQAVSLAQVLKTKQHVTAWDRFESTRIDEELEEW